MEDPDEAAPKGDQEPGPTEEPVNQGEAVAEDEPKQEEEQGDLKQQEEPVQEDAEQTPQDPAEETAQLESPGPSGEGAEEHAEAKPAGPSEPIKATERVEQGPSDVPPPLPSSSLKSLNPTDSPAEPSSATVQVPLPSSTTAAEVDSSVPPSTSDKSAEQPPAEPLQTNAAAVVPSSTVPPPASVKNQAPPPAALRPSASKAKPSPKPSPPPPPPPAPKPHAAPSPPVPRTHAAPSAANTTGLPGGKKFTFTGPPANHTAKRFERLDYSHSAFEQLRINADNGKLCKKLLEISTHAAPTAKATTATPLPSAPIAGASINRRRREDKIAKDNLTIFKRLQAIKPSPDIQREVLAKQYEHQTAYLHNVRKVRAPVAPPRRPSPIRQQPVNLPPVPGAAPAPPTIQQQEAPEAPQEETAASQELAIETES